MAGVLRLALYDLRQTDDRRRHAVAWLRNNNRGIGSAFWICEMLEINRQ
jgi:hypothetical protein